MSDIKDWKYIADDATYDVSLLSPEAQFAFQMIVDLEKRQTLMKDQIANSQKEYAIMVAASKSFNATVSANLNKDAIVDIDVNEPELPDSEVELGEGPDSDWRID